MAHSHIFHRIGRSFLRSESGANAVEFAIVLPILLVCFAASVEAARIYWNYQGAVVGVRDAARYIGRVAPYDICDPDTTGGSATNFPSSATVLDGAGTESLNSRAAKLINRNVTSGGQFPSGVSILAVETKYLCIDGDFYNSPAPVARVRAQVQIELPFAGMFALFNQPPATIQSWITDQSRIYGL